MFVLNTVIIECHEELGLTTVAKLYDYNMHFLYDCNTIIMSHEIVTVEEMCKYCGLVVCQFQLSMHT